MKRKPYTPEERKEAARAACRKWSKANLAYSRAKCKRLRLLHPERYKNYDLKRRKQKTVYTRNRRKTNLNFRIACALRGRLIQALKGAKKSKSALRLLGCSLASFKLYIESKFESGMSWKNHGRGEGKWHIDHEMPCAIFDLTKPEHQRRCFHFSNLQPMWGTENLRKNCKVLSDQFNLL